MIWGRYPLAAENCLAHEFVRHSRKSPASRQLAGLSSSPRPTVCQMTGLVFELLRESLREPESLSFQRAMTLLPCVQTCSKTPPLRPASTLAFCSQTIPLYPVLERPLPLRGLFAPPSVQRQFCKLGRRCDQSLPSGRVSCTCVRASIYALIGTPNVTAHELAAKSSHHVFCTPLWFCTPPPRICHQPRFWPSHPKQHPGALLARLPQ